MKCSKYVLLGNKPQLLESECEIMPYDGRKELFDKNNSGLLIFDLPESDNPDVAYLRRFANLLGGTPHVTVVLSSTTEDFTVHHLGKHVHDSQNRRATAIPMFFTVETENPWNLGFIGISQRERIVCVEVDHLVVTSKRKLSKDEFLKRYGEKPWMENHYITEIPWTEFTEVDDDNVATALKSVAMTLQDRGQAVMTMARGGIVSLPTFSTLDEFQMKLSISGYKPS